MPSTLQPLLLFASLATAAAFPDGLWTGASYDGIEAAEEAVALHQVEVLKQFANSVEDVNAPSPVNTYGRSKLSAEVHIEENYVAGRHVSLRSSRLQGRGISKWTASTPRSHGGCGTRASSLRRNFSTLISSARRREFQARMQNWISSLSS